MSFPIPWSESQRSITSSMVSAAACARIDVVRHGSARVPYDRTYGFGVDELGLLSVVMHLELWQAHGGARQEVAWAG